MGSDAKRPPMTLRQRQVLDYIEGYIDAMGASPTLVEIAKALKISAVTVFGHVGELEAKGYVEREGWGSARNITVLEPRQGRSRQPCGHPVACVEGKTTLHCSMCVLEAERDAALERVRELTEWRPMETAPRDGDAILLLENDGNKALAYWSADADAWASASGYGSSFWADDDYYNGWSHTPPTP